MKLIHVYGFGPFEGDVTALAVSIRQEIQGVQDDVPSYILRFDDPYGLAPSIREAIGWTDRDNPPAMED